MSRLGDEFENLAMPNLKQFLGDTATYYQVDSSTPETITVVFNEFVGAIDEKSRAIFTIASADVSSVPRRGARFILEGETEEWFVVDVREDKAGSIELRCDRSLEDT